MNTDFARFGTKMILWKLNFLLKVIYIDQKELKVDNVKCRVSQKLCAAVSSMPPYQVQQFEIHEDLKSPQPKLVVQMESLPNC